MSFTFDYSVQPDVLNGEKSRLRQEIHDDTYAVKALERKLQTLKANPLADDAELLTLSQETQRLFFDLLDKQDRLARLERQVPRPFATA